jgi:hypothetical protein
MIPQSGGWSQLLERWEAWRLHGQLSGGVWGGAGNPLGVGTRLPQLILSGGCGKALPHHNHQKKRVRAPAARALPTLQPPWRWEVGAIPNIWTRTNADR